jgi:4-amino-4-deoxy-L-arabinose transferase-like glycosyltransferase
MFSSRRELSLQSYISLSLWVGILLLIRSAQQSVMAHDEGWYAQQARWIVESGDWVTQQWWGEPIHDRMMGIQWLIAATYQLFGVSEVTARLPGAIACWGSVLLIYDLGRRCLTAQIAWWGAAILAVTPIWMQAGRLAIQDVPLTGLELLGIWALVMAEEQPQRRYRWGFLVGCTVGLGFMLKSVMVIPVIAALVPYLIWEHPRHRHLTNPALYLGLIVGFIPAAVWLSLSVQRYGWMPIERIFGAVVNLSQSDYHGVGPLYYLWSIPANAFPWPLLSVIGVVMGWRSPYRRKLLWLGYPLVLLTLLAIFKTRTWYYPLQLLPFGALLAAMPLVSLGQQYQSRRQHVPVVLGTTLLLGCLGMILMIAGVAALVQPQWFPLASVWRYGLVAIAAGLGWLVPGLIYGLDRRQKGASSRQRRAGLWQGGWLLGPWGAIALLYATGLWGNYNAPLKIAATTPPLSTELSGHTVNLLVNPEKFNWATQDVVVLTFYTPHPGRHVTDWHSLRSGDFTWMIASDLERLPNSTRVVGGVDKWLLVQMS